MDPSSTNRATYRQVASPDGKRITTTTFCVCDQSSSSSSSSSSSFTSICKETVFQAHRQHHQKAVSFSVAHSFSGIQEEAEENVSVVEEGPFIEPGTDLTLIREWELDFCSRPIIDARGKRLWELLICDSGKNFQFAKFYPNNVINSITLKDALMLMIQRGLPKPQKIRFFRYVLLRYL